MIRLVLLRLLESYFRHRWLYFLPIIIMAGMATYVFLDTKPVYISRGVLYVQKESLLSNLTSVRDDGFSWVTPADATVDEIDELLATDAFVSAVLQQTDLEANKKPDQDVDDLVDELRDALWVQTLGKNNLVLIGVAHEKPEITKQAIEAVTNSYLQWKINADREDSVAAQVFFVDLIEQRQAEVEEARTNMRTYLEQHPEPLRGERPDIEQLDISRLQSEIDLSENRLNDVLEKEENARLATNQAESDVRQTYFVIDAPKLPDQPELSLTDALVGPIILVVVGVILSLVAIIGSALIDRSFRFPIDVRHGLDLPVLAQVPDVRQKRRWWQRGKPEETIPGQAAQAAP